VYEARFDLSTDRTLGQFSGKNYLNLETYRKDGRPVRTTVWFVVVVVVVLMIDSGELSIRTLEDSGKVKRLRANSKVRIVPSSFGGKPRGSWIDATAERADGEYAAHINDLFKKKYGIQKTLTDFVNGLRGKKYITYRLLLGDRPSMGDLEK
jgi:PPOX class probable F420-dependent enzyme